MQKLTRINGNRMLVSDHKKAELVEALHGYEMLNMSPDDIRKTMGELRDALAEKEAYIEGMKEEIHNISKKIRNQRPAGKWIRIDEPSRPWMCSNCKDSFNNVDTCMRKPQWKHCPNCGASMAAGDEKKAE
ncbi:MAG: hypothetical protein MJ117_00430 [Lachnospiraceae bacterium]|nr:hypothetical protein [Lachnospiraceae bacterium]